MSMSLWSEHVHAIIYYRPQQWLRKGNVFTSVCQKFCPGCRVCVAGGLHLRGYAWWWEACVAGGMHGREGACMAGETATAADSTHPTGMHSCLRCSCRGILGRWPIQGSNVMVCLPRKLHLGVEMTSGEKLDRKLLSFFWTVKDANRNESCSHCCW